MARFLFIGEPALYPPVTPGDPPTLASDAVFTLWSQRVGGTQYTDIRASDGVTFLTTLVLDENGVPPVMYGPEEIELMYIQVGAGARFPLFAVDALAQVLDQFRVIQTALADAQAAIIVLQAGGVGGGLPVGTTLDNIPNGVNRLAMTPAERTKLQTVATGATALTIGPLNTQAKAGDYVPTPEEIGAVRNKGGFAATYGITASQVKPEAADGAVDGDWLAEV